VAGIAPGRSGQWQNWRAVTAAPVPARFLSAASGPAVIMEPYDTTELPTEAGQEFTVLAEDISGGGYSERLAVVPLRRRA
jgi:hypothetical protein